MERAGRDGDAGFVQLRSGLAAIIHPNAMRRPKRRRGAAAAALGGHASKGSGRAGGELQGQGPQFELGRAGGRCNPARGAQQRSRTRRCGHCYRDAAPGRQHLGLRGQLRVHLDLGERHADLHATGRALPQH